jgi:hypothetical protein
VRRGAMMQCVAWHSRIAAFVLFFVILIFLCVEFLFLLLGVLLLLANY